MEVYEFHPLNNRSNLTVDDPLKDSARVYLDAVKWKRLIESLDSWDAPLVCGLYKLFRGRPCRTCAPCIWTTLCLTLRAICRILDDCTCIIGGGKSRREQDSFTVMRGDGKWRYDIYDCAKQGTNWMFFEGKVGKWLAVGFYSGTLMYTSWGSTDLSERRRTSHIHGVYHGWHEGEYWENLYAGLQPAKFNTLTYIKRFTELWKEIGLFEWYRRKIRARQTGSCKNHCSKEVVTPQTAGHNAHQNSTEHCESRTGFCGIRELVGVCTHISTWRAVVIIEKWRVSKFSFSSAL